MAVNDLPLEEWDAHAFHFYRTTLKLLEQSGVPVLVGGAYALGHYTGIVRHTKDFDLFTRPADAGRALDVLADAGYRTELTFAHWLGKTFSEEDLVDIIFCSGNGLCPVDDGWFEHASAGMVLGKQVGLIPVEEMIWQKAFIMERERFDGADIHHLLRARGPSLDWERLLARFGPNWRVLLSHLVLFGFVYPADQAKLPRDIVSELTTRLLAETQAGPGEAKLCRGTLLSRGQYLTDLETWGYRDARLPPWGRMAPEQINRWTAAISR